MDNKITAGCIVTTKFALSGSSVFSGYIEYIDRDEATRNEAIPLYSLYSDYMDNPEKTTDLFSANADKLTPEEKKQYKVLYEQAQKNGSPMWQTVISFDNRWLEEHGLYNNGILNENKIKEFTRASVNRMLENEGIIETSIWTAAIHYNTDNLHIHISAVEPTPTREKINIRTIRLSSAWINDNDIIQNEYIKYDRRVSAHKSSNYGYRNIHSRIIARMKELGYSQRSFGDYITINSNGSIDISYHGNHQLPPFAELVDEHTEYRGTFKNKSIELCKSRMVNQIVEQTKDNNLIMTALRDSMSLAMRNDILSEEQDIVSKYLQVYNSLPQNDKAHWQYGYNKIAHIRPHLDTITELYLQRHMPDEFNQFKSLAYENANTYKEGYGANSNANKHYQNKLKDLYKRCGNAILDNMRNRSYDEIKELNNSTYIAAEVNEASVTGEIIDFDGDISYDRGKYRIKYWNNKFKSAKAELKKALELDEEQLIEKRMIVEKSEQAYIKQARLGNDVASFELGRCYELGTFGKVDKALSDKYYQLALTGFSRELEINNNDYFSNLRDIDDLRKTIASNSNYKNDLKELLQNSDEIEWMRNFLEYKIGRMYIQGKGAAIDITTGISHLEQSSNPYAYYSLGNIYYRGYKSDTENVEQNYRLAYENFEKAGFTGVDEKEVPFAVYNMAEMLENELVDDDRLTADYLYSKALDLLLDEEYSEPNDQIEYKLGKMYLEGKGCTADISKAEEYFFSSAVSGNTYAQVKLASIYEQSGDATKMRRAAILLEVAAEGNNPLAQYKLGKIYTDETLDSFNPEEGIRLLEASAAQDNEYAQYRLGCLYLNGTIVSRDNEKGLDYLNASVQHNNQFAQYKLGCIYLEGEVVDFNIYKALMLLEQSAQQDNSFAQYKLGILAYKGEYVEQDIDKTLEYLTASAAQENQFAQYTLGCIYLKGEVVEKNSSLALELLTASAEQENQFAQYQLGKLYYFGNEDVERNEELATYYLNAASAQGNEFADALLNWKPQTGAAYTQKSFDITESMIGLASDMRELFENLANEHEHMLNQAVYDKLQNEQKKASEQGQEH